MKNVSETVVKTERPVKVLQFGEGNFLRAFVDWIIDQLNEKGDFNGDVMMVQPLAQGMGEMINSQNGVYTTVLRGVQNGKTVEEFRKITSVKGCINPYSDYEAFIAQAENPDLRFIISNTTEAGIAYHEGDKLEDKPQVSYPGKVCAFLYHRYKAFNGASDKGIIAIPCELIDKNGDNLKRIVLQYAKEWNLEEGFVNWLNDACDFCNSLVDRIVPGYPRAEAEDICNRLGYKDNLLDAAEIFLLWVIECHGKMHDDELPTAKAGVNVVWTDDMSFYRTRKVRILNGAHTMTVLAAYQTGLNTVEECIKSPLIYPMMKRGLFEEIIPSMDGDKAQLEQYAGDVLERFANPHIVHLLLSISLNSVSKFKTRDLPSLLGYYQKKGELPTVLTFSLAALISFYNATEKSGVDLKGSRNGEEYLIKDSPEVLEKFASLYSAEYCCNGKKSAAIAKAVLSDVSWWGQDLTQIPGLEEKVAGYLKSIWDNGMTKTIESL
ncbi:MAG: tagaturonate reductase [Candidatus Ornithospirochaeta sp.]|nr:tagaturonate reductase [Candidatus Ornithospirochaeta sp.]